MSKTSGSVAGGFERVADMFEKDASDDRDSGAQLCAYVGNRCVVDLVAGPHLALDSLTGVFSVTKGVAALLLATLIEEGSLSLEAPVADLWPDFAAAGKAEVTVRELLAHRAGLPVLEGGLTPADVTATRASAARLARQTPLWRPGTAFGYHALTIGILMEELVRRVTGQALQALYEERIRQSRGIDVYLGLDPALDARYQPLLSSLKAAQPATAPADAIRDAALGWFGQARQSLASFSPDNAAVRAAGPTAAGGVASAHGLARLYAAALGHIGQRFVSPGTLATMTQIQSCGRDLVLNEELCFGTVFMRPNARMPFGSFRAFGHDGAGGALAFADPCYDLAFGYIPMPMVSPGGTDSQGMRLSRAIRACLPPPRA